MSPTISTHLEEFGDPTKLEDEGEVPFRKVLHNSLSHIGRHILVGSRDIREGTVFLDLVDAVVADGTDNEHPGWDREAKEGDPELGISSADQD